MQAFISALLYVVLSVVSLFLIGLVLIQRGKGGGLAGAFGGAGGSSAFGTKAGDVFTRVTMITAGIWISLAMLLVVVANRRSSAWESGSTKAAKSSEFTPSKTEKADLDKAGTPGETIEPGKGVPLPKTDKPSAIPPSEVSGAGPIAPLPAEKVTPPAPK